MIPHVYEIGRDGARGPRRVAVGRAMAALCLALMASLLGVAACSGDNRAGPDVTCEDLECGRVNACENGIIAACPDGKTVQWFVCSSTTSRNVCTASWQTPGAYRCDVFDPACDGCNPLMPACPADEATDGD